jgi:hypothetical protein
LALLAPEALLHKLKHFIWRHVDYFLPALRAISSIVSVQIDNIFVAIDGYQWIAALPASHFTPRLS